MERIDSVLATVIDQFFEIGAGHELRPPAALDSPIENLLDYQLNKYVDRRARIFSQYPVRTQCGPRLIDFVLERDSLRIGIECDGRDYHIYERDLWRDAVILGTGAVDTIYRLSGSMITHRPADAVYIIAGQSPMHFSDRGRLNLERLASTEAKKAWSIYAGRVRVVYRDEETGALRTEAVERRSLGLPEIFLRWAYAQACGERDLETLIERFFAERRLPR